jgi:hypothetical protein
MDCVILAPVKLSVSVPDPLWEEARQQRPDLNPSRLVQVALDSWVQPRSAPAFSLEPPADAGPAFAAAREHMAAEVRREFEEGYRAALAAANSIRLLTFQELADDYRFDVAAWARDRARRAMEGVWMGPETWWAWDVEEGSAVAKALGSVIPHPALDTESGRTAPFVRGFAEALRNLWETVIQGPPADSRHADDLGTDIEDNTQPEPAPHMAPSLDDGEGAPSDS